MTILYKGNLAPSDFKMWDGSSATTFSRDTDTGGAETLNRMSWSGIDILEVFGDKTNRNLATINSALERIGSSNSVAVWLSPGSWSITDDVTITSNINLIVPPGASLSITAGKTITINGPFSAGTYQVFSTTGTVIFGSLATKEVLPHWWGGVGDANTDNYAAFAAAIASLPNGGKIYIPAGRYKLTDELAVHSGLTIKGAGHVNYYYGVPSGSETPTFLYQDTNSKAIFTLAGVSEIHLSDMSLSANPNPTTSPHASRIGIDMESSGADGLFTVTIDRITFYDLDKGISVNDTTAPNTSDWNASPVTIRDCTFYACGDGIYFNTNNADAWLIMNTNFYVTDNSNGVYIVRSGFVTMISCAGGGWDASPINRVWLRVDDVMDNIQLINCQCENTTYMMVVEGSTADVYRPITFNGCIVEDDIYLNRSCHFISIASRYTNQVYAHGDNIKIDTFADTFSSDAVGFQLLGANTRINNSLRASAYSATPGLPDGTVLNGRTELFTSHTYPTTGLYAAGDLSWNNNPGAYKYAGWVCEFALVTALNGGEPSGETSMVVDSGAGTLDGDIIGVRQDDDTVKWTTIASGGATTTLVLTDGLTDDAADNSEVFVYRWVKFGSYNLTGSATWDPGSIGDGNEESKEVTVTGAALGDFAIASFSLDVTDLVLDAQVTAADTVTCILANNTGGNIDLASGTIRAKVFKN